ncbi:MAG: hypothetical protein IIC40_08885 [Candidatus Marinimicrobia bacterium]|nr:hypothetical protein [Candidatus Neomarinimicrobiota bacterium]
MRALVRGGSLGLIGDHVLGEYHRDGRGAQEIGGPIITNALDAFDIGKNIIDGKPIGNKALS